MLKIDNNNRLKLICKFKFEIDKEIEESKKNNNDNLNWLLGIQAGYMEVINNWYSCNYDFTVD